MNTFSNQVTRALSDIGIERPEGVDFLTLHDIFRLMPKIGEKMEFGDIGSTFSYVWNKTMSREPDSEDECIFENHKENRPPCEVYSHYLLDAFLSGDYPEAEKVLLDLLKEHE